MVAGIKHRRFTVEQYHQMAEAGILGEDDRVELLDGEIVEMSPIGARHAGIVNRLSRMLVQQVGDAASVSVQNPVRLSEYSEPRPDLMLLRPRSDDYIHTLPGPEDVLLLIEVADTTVTGDRLVKLPLYAHAGIREVWLCNLSGRAVAPGRAVPTGPILEVYRRPDSDGYGEIAVLRPGQHVTPEALPAQEFRVAELLGEASRD